MSEQQALKIVIAPDSFKQSLTAKQVAMALYQGWSRVYPKADYQLVPMADGGEGTVQSLIDATGGERIEEIVSGPLGTPVHGFWGLLGDGKTAVIEMAAAAGLEYLSDDARDPMRATTYGVGELIRSALDHGATHIILGLGGSATNDAGAGMAEALGFRLLDEKGQKLAPGGAALSRLASIDASAADVRLAQTRVDLASDVTNPLTGENGASAVFGPQKGATPEHVRLLDDALAHFAAVARRDLTIDVENKPGAGAAGGLGAGGLCFLNGQFHSGIDLMIHETGLREKIRDASLVITGEGKIDGQTIFGKTPIGVARCAKEYGIPVVAVAGYLAPDASCVYAHGIDCIFSITPGILSLQEALQTAEQNLIRAAENIARLWAISSQT